MPSFSGVNSKDEVRIGDKTYKITELGIEEPSEGLLSNVYIDNKRYLTKIQGPNDIWGIIHCVYSKTTEALIATVTTCNHRGSIFLASKNKIKYSYYLGNDSPLNIIIDSQGRVIIETQNHYIIIKRPS